MGALPYGPPFSGGIQAGGCAARAEVSVSDRLSFPTYAFPRAYFYMHVSLSLSWKDCWHWVLLQQAALGSTSFLLPFHKQKRSSCSELPGNGWVESPLCIVTPAMSRDGASAPSCPAHPLFGAVGTTGVRLQYDTQGHHGDSSSQDTGEWLQDQGLSDPQR